jgi:hypothetical protein
MFYGILKSSMKFKQISPHLTKFHSIKAYFFQISLYFATYHFHFQWVTFGLLQIMEILDLAITKDEKVNMAVTYLDVCREIG